MKKLLLTAAMLGALSAPAYAQVVLGGQTWTNTGTTLSLDATVPGGNQPLNIQCIICGDNQPQQALDFGYTNFKNSGNLSDAIFFSTNVSGGGNPGVDTVGLPYDGSFLRAYLEANGDPSLTFSIGIDVNDTGTPQTLEAFALLNLTQHTVLAQYSLLQPGGALIPSQNNGTGFPDYTLNGFNINLGSDIQLGDQLIFYARISGANDGPDSFFLIPQQVPGPIAGAGIPGLIAACGFMLALARNRRRKNGELGVA
jgi:opacity protein-like surface antigen